MITGSVCICRHNFLLLFFIFILFYFILFFFSRTHGKQHRVREGVRIRNA